MLRVWVWKLKMIYMLVIDYVLFGNNFDLVLRDDNMGIYERFVYINYKNKLVNIDGYAQPSAPILKYLREMNLIIKNE